ncbi:hypothetical protein GCM10007860_08690 [Chitiniphilus shinanonensis]|uniref:Uncharacterized protein n=1 Tax=Chitiniphilus shinanonensis TaxID=553088 RepID=A0ABQ6BQI8_9NEIS|nr:hypothetical protein [Chitiniphilus shinanonensis]GLS03724.1 hypothetical protein GCM10007860_08690 [Chitiniphilus shinanonensis]
MNSKPIKHYGDFVAALLDAGFSMGGGNDEGIHAVVTWNWNEQPPYETPVRWHTGDPETDPWEWRIRVLDERTDIAYAKLFFKKSGYITREWAPYFLAVRRANTTFDEDYANGTISHHAKRIHQAVIEHDALPLHAIKQLAGFGKEEKSIFERALNELQMKMYLTMCGRQQKVSRAGEEFGWSSTVFCTTERFWGEAVFAEASNYDKQEAIQKITERVRMLNANADPKKLSRFIKG